MDAGVLIIWGAVVVVLGVLVAFVVRASLGGNNIR